jgi:hypothetical protein
MGRNAATTMDESFEGGEATTDVASGVARTIAQSEAWVLVHLVIELGLILMLGGLVAISRSIEGRTAWCPGPVGVRRRRGRRHRGGSPRDR